MGTKTAADPNYMQYILINVGSVQVGRKRTIHGQSLFPALLPSALDVAW